MKVGLDISSIAHGAGIGRYTALLTTALSSMLLEDVEFVFFTRRSLPSRMQYEQARIVYLPSSRLVYEGFLLGRAIENERVQVFHSPDFLLPSSLKAVGIITVHDLSPWDERGSVSLRAGWLYRFFLPSSIHRATAIAVDSEFTRSRLRNHFPEATEKVRVVYPAISPIFKPLLEEKIKEVVTRYSLPSPYVLFVGTLEERKNLPLLLRVVERLQKEYSLGMVVVGRRGRGASKIVSELKSFKSCRWLPYLPDDDLTAVYGGCALFLYPSRYEGFGYPPLEAMACGAPVVASRCGALPESVGDGGILVEPEEEAFLEASSRILSDSSFRDNLIQRGYEWVKRFPASATVSNLLSLYRSIL